MEIGRRELVVTIRRILIVPCDEITLHDLLECFVGQELAAETIERRRPTRNARGDENPAGLQNSHRLLERGAPVVGTHEVIQWSEKQDDVGNFARLWESAGVRYAARSEMTVRMCVA